MTLNLPALTGADVWGGTINNALTNLDIRTDAADAAADAAQATATAAMAAAVAAQADAETAQADIAEIDDRVPDGVLPGTIARLQVNDLGYDQGGRIGAYADAGQEERIDCKPIAGAIGIYHNLNDRPPIISGNAYVMHQSNLDNAATLPNVWAFNPVVIKQATNAQAGTDTGVYGIEISVSNNTAETALPGYSGHVTGLFVSYIHTSNTASAAILTGGLSAGWNVGIWIDGIKPTTGRAIVVQDEVSPQLGMDVGLDTSGVASFVTGAILVGNNQKIVGRTTAAANRNMIYIDASNELIVGDTVSPTNLKIAATGLTFAIPTTATATAGTSGALPAQVAGYLAVTNTYGQSVRIPYYFA
jgi:hypothetical protein